MVKSPINAALAAVCLTLGIALTAVLIFPPQQYPTHNREQSAAAKNQNGDRREMLANPNAQKNGQQVRHEVRWYNIFEHPAEGWIALFNGLLVIVTGWLVWATKQLWEAGEKQAVIARDAANAAARSAEIAERALTWERAFVFVEHVHATPTFEADAITGWDIRVTWKNFGSTPTRDLHIYRNYDFFDGPLPDNFYFPDHVKRGQAKDAPRTFIGPKGTKEAVGPPFPMSDLRNVRDRSKQLYMWGWAEYCDIFTPSQRRRSEFCFEVVVKGDLDRYMEREPRGPFNFLTYKTHNGSEDDCYRRAGETIPLFEF